MKKLLLLDGSSLLFRAFYALPLLTGPSGEYTNAIAGFANMLVKLIKERQPDLMAVAFDKSRHTFRTEIYPEYKGTRGETPEEFKAQVPLLEKMLAAWGITFLEIDGYEADDILGTLAKKAQSAGDIDTAIVTGDRDALQLIGENVRVLYTKRGITDIADYDERAFRAEYADLPPASLIDIKGLMGDSSDNIPGVPGIGAKTALKLLVQYGSLENVLSRAGEIKGKKLSEKIIAHADEAKLSKKLATIVCDMAIPVTVSDLVISPDMKEMAGFCLQHGLNSLQKSFHQLYKKTTVIDKNDTNGLFAKDSGIGANEVQKGGDTDAAGLDLAALGKALDDLVPGTVIEGDADNLFDSATGVYELKSLFHSDPERATALSESGVIDFSIASYVLSPSEADPPLSRLIFRYLSPEEREEDSAEALLKKLVKAMDRELDKSGRKKLYLDMELPLAGILAAMERAGIFVDRDALREEKERAAQKIADLTADICRLAGEDFNVNSSRQLAEILFEKLGLPPLKKTKTGYSTNAEVLEELRNEHPIVERILEYRLWSKLKSTYLDGLEPLIDEKGRIHTTFNQTVTATGRLSSSEPNLQNIPVRTEEGKAIRSLFRPDKAMGYDLLMSADYSQIELRILAHLSGDKNFLAAFQKGEDIHARTAAEVFGVPLEMVTPTMRRRAKAVNFGIVYGISDYGLARDLGISRSEAADYIKKYFSTCPGIKAFLDKTVAFAHNKGYVETIFCRRRELAEISSKNFNRRSMAERMAMNTPIQGAAADIIKLAMIAADRTLKERGLKSRLLLQVHDELVLEVTAAEKESVERLIKEAMENVVKLSVPLPVDIHFGETWAQAK